MAAAGKTPILLYGSTTASNAPVAGNLTNSSDGCEIAINVADKNLFFKDSTNAVNTVPIRQSSASSNGWLSSTDWSTFNGKAPSFTYTTSYIPYGQGTTTPTQSSNFTYSGGLLSVLSGSIKTGSTLSTSGSVLLQDTYFYGSLTNLSTEFANGGPVLGYGVTPSTSAAGSFVSAVSTISVPRGAYTINQNIHYWHIGAAQTVAIGSSVTMSEAMRLDASANLTLNTGNLVIGTSGKGIDFSATAGTGTSELLADYEEGTWTPTYTFDIGTPTITYTTQIGYYRKIGSMVTVWFKIEATGMTISDYFARIGSLPFVSGINNNDIRTRIENSNNSDFWIAATGYPPVMFKSSAINDFAKGNDISGYQVAGVFSYFV